jgi:hypothetical protein
MPSDRQALILFVDALENDVVGLLLAEHLSVLREDLVPSVKDAWPAIGEACAELRAWLREEQADESAKVDALLAGAGLTGPQLELKLRGFWGALRRHVRPQRNARVRWFREVFSWANIILGSLATVVSIAELLKEFKECLEAGTDYSGSAAQYRDSTIQYR